MRNVENRVNITEIWRVNSSINGNPRFHVRGTTTDGQPFDALTAVDSAVGYFIESLAPGRSTASDGQAVLITAGVRNRIIDARPAGQVSGN